MGVNAPFLTSKFPHTVDGSEILRNPAPVEVGSLSDYSQGFMSHPRWLFGFLNHQQ